MLIHIIFSYGDSRILGKISECFFAGFEPAYKLPTKNYIKFTFAIRQKVLQLTSFSFSCYF